MLSLNRSSVDRFAAAPPGAVSCLRKKRLLVSNLTWRQHLAIWLFVLAGSSLAVHDFLQTLH